MSYFIFQHSPDFRENRSVIGIRVTETMNLLAEPFIVVRLRFDKMIERSDDLTVFKKNGADTANTCRTFIGCFKIYGNTSFHRSIG